MVVLAEILGSSGDALDFTLVIALIGATVTITGWLHRMNANLNLRIALIEQRLGLDGKRSGVYPTHEDK